MTETDCKTLPKFKDECTWCNEGYRCLECNGCLQQFVEQKHVEVKQDEII